MKEGNYKVGKPGDACLKPMRVFSETSLSRGDKFGDKIFWPATGLDPYLDKIQTEFGCIINADRGVSFINHQYTPTQTVFKNLFSARYSDFDKDVIEVQVVDQLRAEELLPISAAGGDFVAVPALVMGHFCNIKKKQTPAQTDTVVGGKIKKEFDYEYTLGVNGGIYVLLLQ
jgi:hypothetical protein